MEISKKIIVLCLFTLSATINSSQFVRVLPYLLRKTGTIRPIRFSHSTSNNMGDQAQVSMLTQEIEAALRNKDIPKAKNLDSILHVQHPNYTGSTSYANHVRKMTEIILKHSI